MKRIIAWIPNTITCLNLLAGCVAIIFSFNIDTQYGALCGRQWVYVCIAAAALFDFCDGLAARTLKAYSAIGAELDSLSDLVSFGVAPGLLMLNTMASLGECQALPFVALLIPVCGALRLAKFNVDDSQTTSFVGLPIPANALFWIGLSAWIDTYGYPGGVAMAVIVLVMASAMLWPLRMFSLKFKNLSIHDNAKRYGIVLAAIAFVAVYGVSGFVWTILLYLLLSFFSRRRAE